jgi:hypothetical protein
LAVGVCAAAGPTPKWEQVPNGAIDHRAFAVAAGRVWLFDGPPGGGKVVVRSARVTSGGLTSWTAVPFGAASQWSYVATLGDDMVFSIGIDPTLRIAELRAIRLLPSGRIGRPAEVGTAAPAASSNGSRVVRLRDRVLQFADPKPQSELIEPGVCCDVEGKVVDQSSLIRPIVLTDMYLGLDRHGRLWLAWTYLSGKLRDTSWAVALDSRTLLPRGKPQTAPSLRFAHIVDLVCAETCRLVMSGATRSRSSKARAFSWAPGESAPTGLVTPLDNGNVIAASYHQGRVVVAYTATDAKVGLVLALARGDARGRNLRPVNSIAVPQYLGTVASGRGLTVGPIGAFGPGGFGAFTVYEAARGHTVRAVLLPY